MMLWSSQCERMKNFAENSTFFLSNQRGSFTKEVNFTKYFERDLVSQSQCGKIKNLLSSKNFPSKQLFSNFFSKTVTFTKFLPKMCEREFP